MKRAYAFCLFSSLFLLCFLTHLLFFVCLATFKIKQIFRLSHFATPLNANARERYPFLVRYYWQQKAKSKVRFFIVVSLFRRFIQSTAGRREKERERERKRSSFVFVVFCALNYDSFFSRKSFLLSLLLCLLLSKRAQTERDERERERERIIDS